MQLIGVVMLIRIEAERIFIRNVPINFCNPFPNCILLPAEEPADQVAVGKLYRNDEVHARRRRVGADRKTLRLAFQRRGSPGSPVHFFWGSFDLAVTRFSGRRAPLHPGGVPGLPDAITREAYSHEVSSAGFWPGNDAFPQAAFYSYAYPEPTGFRDRPVTAGGYFEAKLGEFVLPYDTLRSAAKPDALLFDFLSSTYAAAAEA